MHYIALLLTGALLCNCIPHLASGLRGEWFPTPFATPRGVGRSSPLLNFIWGTANGVAGGLLLAHQGMPAAISPASLCLLLGFLVMGGYLSRHFGKVRLSSQWHG